MPAAAVTMPAAVTTRYAHAPVDPTGRHRRAMTLHTRIGRTLDVVSRLGSLVTLAALLVLGATVGGLVDGAPATGAPTVTVTFDGGGR